MNKLYSGSRYLVTLDSPFVALDNGEYLSVFGIAKDEIDLDDVPEKTKFVQFGDISVRIKDIKAFIRTESINKDQPRLQTLRNIYKA